MENETKTYCIVRHFRDMDKDREILETGLTLEEVQEHCNDPNTRGDDFFDGYEEE